MALQDVQKCAGHLVVVIQDPTLSFLHSMVPFLDILKFVFQVSVQVVLSALTFISR